MSALKLGTQRGWGWGEKFWVKACIFEDSWRSSRASPNMDSGARLSRWSQLCHLLAVLTWANYLTSLCLSFLICKMEIILHMIAMRIKHVVTHNKLRTIFGIIWYSTTAQ